LVIKLNAELKELKRSKDLQDAEVEIMMQQQGALRIKYQNLKKAYKSMHNKRNDLNAPVPRPTSRPSSSTITHGPCVEKQNKLNLKLSKAYQKLDIVCSEFNKYVKFIDSFDNDKAEAFKSEKMPQWLVDILKQNVIQTNFIYKGREINKPKH
jgi:hypothetical protein